jgi:hypothetical protein
MYVLELTTARVINWIVKKSKQRLAKEKRHIDVALSIELD